MAEYIIDCHLVVEGRPYLHIQLGIAQNNGIALIETVAGKKCEDLSGLVGEVVILEGLAGGRIVAADNRDLDIATICKPRQHSGAQP